MSVYADSSLVVSLYITDEHSREARRRMARQPRIWLTPLHRVEWSHAISQHLFRRTLSSQDATQLYSEFEADRSSRLWDEVPIPDSTYETAVDLAEKHGPRLNCRSLDTLHVACALELGAREFWTFDQRQLQLARAAGLRTD